jgi:hypothetical protein
MQCIDKETQEILWLCEKHRRGYELISSSQVSQIWDYSKFDRNNLAYQLGPLDPFFCSRIYS